MHSALAARLTGILALIAAFLLDQWSKAAILAHAFSAALPHDVVPVFNLVLVRNHGISFGILGGGGDVTAHLLTAVTSLVALGLFIWLLRVREWQVGVALGFIIGGAVGNILDRVRFGAVTDFLDFHWGPHHWPAFNIADSSIFMGVVILVLIGIVRPSDQKESQTS